MPTRLSQRTERKAITPFLGMVSDKGSSINRKPGHMDLLDNCFSDLDLIKKRLGYTTWVATHTTGSKVYGLHYQVSGGVNFANIKMINGTSNMYFYDIGTGAWIQFTGHTFPSSDASFVEMDGFDEYNSVTDISDTVKTGTTVTDVLLVTSANHDDNSLVGKVARFTNSAGDVEYKVIEGNYHDGTDDHLLFDTSPLNAVPANAVAIKIYDKGNMLYVAGGNEFAVISSQEAGDGIGSGVSSVGYRQLNGTSPGQNGFSKIESHGNRIFGILGRVLSFSDLFNGHNFSKNSYFEFSTTVQAVKSFTDDVLIIYEARKTWALIGTKPSTWELRLIDSNVGCLYPRTIDNYTSTAFTMQLFVASDGSVRGITSDTFKQISRETQIQSLSKDYIETEFQATFNFLCAGIDNHGKYTVFQSDGTIYTLNIRKSEQIRFREWLWSKGSTPIIFYSALKHNGFLRLGGNASGQVYTWNSGNSDLGLSIDLLIRRRGLNFDALGDKTKFKYLDIAHGSDGDSTTFTVKAEANNSGTSGTIDHTLGTYDPSTGNKHRELKIPNNPSNSEGSGHMLDYEISESSTVDVASIEEIAFRYKPSLLK